MKAFMSLGPVGLIFLLLIPAMENSKAKGQSTVRQANALKEQDGWKEFRVFHPKFPITFLTFLHDGTTLVTAETWWPGQALMVLDRDKTKRRHPLEFSDWYGETLWDVTKDNEKSLWTRSSPIVLSSLSPRTVKRWRPRMSLLQIISVQV